MVKKIALKQAGFTLLEVLISLGILSTVFVGIASLADAYARDARLAFLASQTRTFGDATRAYIKDNYSAIAAVATPTAPALVNVSTLIAAGKLPAGFSATNNFGQSFCALVLEPTVNRLQALVVAEGGTILDDISLIGTAGLVGGSGGGVQSTDAATVRGSAGSWTLPVATYDNLVNNLGQNCLGTAGNVRLAVGRPVMALWFENGDTSGAFVSRDAVPGRPELNEMNTPLVMNSVAVPNAACTRAGAIARDATGAVLSCQSSVWKTQGSAFWQDPVASFAALPACAAASSGQTRIVSTPSVGSGPRAYTCDGASWIALAVDNSGNITIPGIATSGKVALTDVVSQGSACSNPSGSVLVARDASGLILSCQSGVWKIGAGGCSLGVNQSWQNMAGSRWWYGSYSNDTACPIAVSITSGDTANPGGYFYVNGQNVATNYMRGGTTGGQGLFSIIPVGAIYQYNPMYTASSGLIWMELR